MLDPVSMHILRQHDVIPPKLLKTMAEEIGLHFERAPSILIPLSIIGLVGLTGVLFGAVPNLLGGGDS